MSRVELFQEIIDETRELMLRAAHPTRNTVVLSPEVADLLSRVGTRPDAEAALGALKDDVAACTKCPLSGSRTQTVFGQGNPNADLVFVGEAPGQNEDEQGLAFVGKAGQLLTDIIQKGMNLTRDDVFICNVLKCRPPDNRDPKPDEVAQCLGYLAQQLDLIQPKVICALGGHAAKTLLQTSESTGRLRGRWHSYRGIPVRVTYHPSYLLHKQNNPSELKAEKRKVWEDIQHVMRLLNGEETASPDNAPGQGRLA